MSEFAGTEAGTVREADVPEAVRRAAVGGPADAVLELQRRYGNRAVSRMLTARAPPPQRRLLQRLRFNVGSVQVDIDYSGLHAVADPAAEIRTRYAAFTGSAVPAPIDAAITALAAPARRWVMYGLSALERNAAAAPTLNRADAVQRLIARAPSATTSPTAGGQDFENEVLRVSGWAESALVAPLHAPTGATLTAIQGLYNPPTAAGGTASAPLDVPLLNAEIPPALTALLNLNDPANWATVGTVPLSTLQSIADEIQSEARTFFAPYADTAMASPYATSWQYSSQLFSVTATAPTHDQRIGYLLNRAEIVGRRAGPGGSIFERSNFESGRDDAALLSIVTAMESSATTAAIVDRLLQHTGRTQRSPLRVGISTEWNLAVASECETRWRNILTLSHELCHALVHPSFPPRSSSIRFGQIIREGFTEVLGVQLYRHLRSNAASDAGFKTRMEAGVAGAPCPAPPLGTIGYGQAGPSAESIRTRVGDDNFRAAYFLGAVDLVGL
jgi:hypothetical protein